MNPLFTAHIVADFLLQPTWLVRLKHKTSFGIFIHAVIHALTMFILLIPIDTILALYIVVIATSHGLIDAIKIQYQKKHPAFEPSFLVDQIAHLVILFTASLFMPSPLTFWFNKTGIIILTLLFLLSYGLALFNLHDTTTKKLTFKRILHVTLGFLMYVIPSLAASSYFWL